MTIEPSLKFNSEAGSSALVRFRGEAPMDARSDAAAPTQFDDPGLPLLHKRLGPQEEFRDPTFGVAHSGSMAPFALR